MKSNVGDPLHIPLSLPLLIISVYNFHLVVAYHQQRNSLNLFTQKWATISTIPRTLDFLKRLQCYI